MPDHLYLLTLEIVPLEVGRVYNPLPSHLTLMSRFRSACLPEELTALLSPLFDRTAPVALTFGKETVLGAHKTHVHLIEPSPEYLALHSRLLTELDKAGAVYVTPQFVGSGHIPHVSVRERDGFRRGYTQLACAAYLIEVEVRGEQHLRFVRTKFDLRG